MELKYLKTKQNKTFAKKCLRVIMFTEGEMNMYLWWVLLCGQGASFLIGSRRCSLIENIYTNLQHTLGAW